MRARLKVDVQSRATRFFARLFKSENFRVFQFLVFVGAGANDLSIPVDNDCSHTRVWGR
jgi:hypothetical protein